MSRPLLLDLGLPPLARGALRLVVVDAVPLRPTPARAGSTPTGLSPGSASPAYPRSRGEHVVVIASTVCVYGLPPLARGAPCRSREPPCRRRPTPARAGSTVVRPPAGRGSPAYPRSRGEHRNALPLQPQVAGLPPLTRGAPVRSQAGSDESGPTPAHAGSTTAAAIVPASTAAYPRSRGEHGRVLDEPVQNPGLPPLTRGARHGDGRHLPGRGPTPAHAGSTACPMTSGWMCPAYPRSRGEHVRFRTVGYPDLGLPPLTRGARPARPVDGTPRRPTPAHAGSTK
mgnify:CR=1 FL=1